jgi:hypothetical protein
MQLRGSLDRRRHRGGAADDIAVAQARILLAALDEQVDEISRELEAIERRGPRMSIRGAVLDRRCEAKLRRDLYEAYRLIGGLNRRFPDTPHPPQCTQLGLTTPSTTSPHLSDMEIILRAPQ